MVVPFVSGARIRGDKAGSAHIFATLSKGASTQSTHPCSFPLRTHDVEHGGKSRYHVPRVDAGVPPFGSVGQGTSQSDPRR